MIETPRLTLRSWRADDLDAYFDIYSRAEVMRWLGAREPLASREEAAERLAHRAAPDPAGPPYGVWAVCERGGDDRPWGSVLLRPLPWSEHVEPPPPADDVEIGWHLHPDVWGRGWATEAAQAVLDRARTHGLQVVHAVTYVGNEPSQAVCRRLGMSHVGLTDRYYDVELELFRVAL